MKTRTLIMATALLLVGAGFAACSDSDERLTAVGTPPITPSSEVVNFFKAHLDTRKTDFNFNDISYEETECFLINSMEEFQAIAPQSVELPVIDFAKYSLIVGQHVFPAPRYSLDSQAVEIGTDALTLNLVYEVFPGAAPQEVTTYYFWGLYNKLPGNTIHVEISTI